MQCGLFSGIKTCSETIMKFRRFVSRDKISHYFDRFICQRLYYDTEIA